MKEFNSLTTNVLDKNLLALDKVSPTLANQIRNLSIDENFDIGICKKQGSFLIYKNKKFNSQFDSLREASKTAVAYPTKIKDQNGFIIIGCELGYLVNSFINEYSYHKTIILIDFQLDIIKLCLMHTDLSSLILSEQLKLIFIENIHYTFSYFQNMNIAYFKLIIHQASYKIFPAEYSLIKEQTINSIMIKQVNQQTIERFEKLWLRNTILNSPEYYYNTYKANDLIQQTHSKPAIIIGAGPSLTKQLPTLKKMQDNVIIITASTCLMYLIENNIFPDFIVTVDPQNIVLYHFLAFFQYLQNHKIPKLPVLLAEPTISPSIIRHYPKSIFIKNTLFYPLRKNEQDNNLHLDSGGSVTTAAYCFALSLKCSPIILIGLDLSYDLPANHFNGAPLEQNWTFESQNRFQTIETMNWKYANPESKILYKGFDKPSVETSYAFMTYIQWFENRFAHYSESFPTYNCTEGGIGFTQIPNIPLKQGLTFMNNQYEKPAFNNLPSHSSLSHHRVINLQETYLKYQNQIYKIKPILSKSIKLLNHLILKIHSHQIILSQERKKLITYDQAIEKFPYKDLIHLNIQSLLFKIQNDPEDLLDNHEKDIQELKQLKLSLILYQAFLDSILLSESHIIKALQKLRIF